MISEDPGEKKPERKLNGVLLGRKYCCILTNIVQNNENFEEAKYLLWN